MCWCFRIFGMRIGSILGIQNSTPLSMLHLGNCEVANSAPVIIFGKNVSGGGNRNAFIGYTDSFFFVIGDYGNTNTSNTLTSQLGIARMHRLARRAGYPSDSTRAERQQPRTRPVGAGPPHHNYAFARHRHRRH